MLELVVAIDFFKYRFVQGAEKSLVSVSTKWHEACICLHIFS